MAKVKLLSQAEYAKHRGCSGVAVFKAAKAGRISLIDGKIDPDVADIQWSKNTRVRAPNSKQDDGLAQTHTAEQATAPTAAGDPEDYLVSRSRREAAEAKIAEMKEAEMRGALIRVDSVRRALANKISAMRDALLQIPYRLAPVLAAEPEAERVADLLKTELHQALLQLSEGSSMETPG